MTNGRISRAVPLDQLRAPETDVRERRSEEDVMSLASSMGDPDVGQLQDILVHPVDPGEHVEEGDAEELHSLFQADHPMRVVDGETRRQAARKLGWATVDATIVPRPPENTVIAQLDANTERIEMTEYETVRALKEHYEETGATLKDMQDKVGYSPGYLSELFGLLEAPDWLTEPWRHHGHPLETGHARAVNSFLSADTIETYAQAGDLDDDTARQRAVQDAQLMIDVAAKHEPTVSDFQQRSKRKKKDTIDQLQDQRSAEQKQADGQTRSAEQAHTPAEPPDPEPCLICGSERPNRRKYALPVCGEDYGMLSEAEANGEPLLSQAPAEPNSPPQPEHGHEEVSEAAEALAQASGIDMKEAQAVVQKVSQDAEARRQQGTDD